MQFFVPAAHRNLQSIERWLGFSLVFVSFPFLLSVHPYYAITFFSTLRSPALVSPACCGQGHLQAGILVHSAFSVSHLSFFKKHSFWKIPTSYSFRKRCQHPCVRSLSQKWLSSACCREHPPVGESQEAPRGCSFLERLRAAPEASDRCQTAPQHHSNVRQPPPIKA